MSNKFLVSVLITTKNDEKTIDALLASIKLQSYLNLEIICIDNFSTDTTYDIITSYPTIHLQSGPERSVQRNIALKKAKGDWILWLDADMILKKDTVEECVRRVTANDNLTAIVIQEEVPGNNTSTRIRNFENILYLNTNISTPRFLRKDILKKIKGFDENLTGAEDWDMARRYKEVSSDFDFLESNASCGILHIEEDLTFPVYLKKKHYYAKGCELYEKKWGSTDKIVKTQLKVLPRLVHIVFAPGNLKRILCHPLLTLGMLLWRSFPAFVTYIMHHNNPAIKGATNEKSLQGPKRNAES